MTTDDTLARLVPHIHYELDMLRLAAQMLSSRWPDSVADLFLEAGLIHLRALDDFFGMDPRGDDLGAGHFCKGWRKTPILSPDDRRAINKKLAHITTKRPDKREWPRHLWLPKVCDVWNRFVADIDKAGARDLAQLFGRQSVAAAPAGGVTTTSEVVIGPPSAVELRDRYGPTGPTAPNR